MKAVLQFLNRLFSISLQPFVFSRSEQEKIIEQFPEPSSLMERSFFQFKSQFLLVSWYKIFFCNLAGFVSIFYFFFRGLLGNMLRNKNSLVLDISVSKPLAVFPYKNYSYPDIIPEEIEKEFTVQKENFMAGYQMNRKDIWLLCTFLWTYPFQFYFAGKCFSKILFYRFLITKYSPKVIICSSEYSFTSSILTSFCRQNSIEHINVMHGEKFFLIRDSFFEFDRFYVWDSFYKELFISLRAEHTQFILGTYGHLKMNIESGKEAYKYTYYLANEKEEALTNIKSNLEKLTSSKNVAIRCHPRYTDKVLVNAIFEGFEVENSLEVTLEESFNRTKNVISLYSSCLVQAYLNGKAIVIDDISHDSNKLKTLKESDYIILSKPHQLMSTIMKTACKHEK